VVAVIGLLASVAIPSFLTYVRRSRTIEATMNVRKIYDGALMYADVLLDREDQLHGTGLYPDLPRGRVF
jgi:type II secretory pathway pseudopilin PulG